MNLMFDDSEPQNRFDQQRAVAKVSVTRQTSLVSLNKFILVYVKTTLITDKI